MRIDDLQLPYITMPDIIRTYQLKFTYIAGQISHHEQRSQVIQILAMYCHIWPDIANIFYSLSCIRLPSNGNIIEEGTYMQFDSDNLI